MDLESWDGLRSMVDLLRISCLAYVVDDEKNAVANIMVEISRHRKERSSGKSILLRMRTYW